MKPAYYNEIDEFAAAWLRELIKAGHIAPGDVDTRSIEDVHPDDLRPYTQCHFFAGIGVWSYALRRAGWPDDRRVWTASCPCQPFSAAGQGAGFADERHLWPHLHYLTSISHPATVIGEQVASKDADPWIDLVQTDMEALGYAFGAVPFPSAGVGAPHIRDRLYWVADAYGSASYQRGADIRGRITGGDAQPRAGFGGSSLLDGMGYTAGTGPQGGEPAWQRSDAQCAPTERTGAASRLERPESGRQQGKSLRAGTDGQAFGNAQRGDFGGLADSNDDGREPRHGVRPIRQERDTEHGGNARAQRPGPTNGLWQDADWLLCRDGKWRPVEPGTFPLVNGASARVGRLRGYGNAINAEQARIFIEAVGESVK